MDKPGGIKHYFSLTGPYPAGGPGGTGERSQAKLFSGVLLGALSKVVYDALTQATAVDWKHLTAQFVIAAIASVVVFPKLYYSGGLGEHKLSFAHWALAFENGFFWSVALATLIAKFNR